ncbi:MAG: DUF2203 domain-containing protein [Planctomycetaceae bacterium]|nr:DUF2203 domain-containing protein [Planctomycetaceae bacterium]
MAPNPGDQQFSIEDANRMLPLVRAIVADIVQLASDIEDRQDRLNVVSDRQSERDDLYAEELQQMQHEIDQDEDRLDDFIQELVDLGVELQDAIVGEVDFRTRVDGREVLLCWKLGEAEVSHWHTEDAGFAGRQSLLQGVGSSGDFPSPDVTET